MVRVPRIDLTKIANQSKQILVSYILFRTKDMNVFAYIVKVQNSKLPPLKTVNANPFAKSINGSKHT